MNFYEILLSIKDRDGWSVNLPLGSESSMPSSSATSILRSATKKFVIHILMESTYMNVCFE